MVSASLALRSLVWTILLPGIVAGYVPWRFFGLDRVTLTVNDPLAIVGTACIVCSATPTMTTPHTSVDGSQPVLAHAPDPRLT